MNKLSISTLKPHQAQPSQYTEKNDLFQPVLLNTRSNASIKQNEQALSPYRSPITSGRVSRDFFVDA